MAECFDRELRILQSTKHPNIVELNDICYTPHLILVIMEYCSGGDLLTAVQSRKFFNESDCCTILLDVLQALHYLHQHSISHRDLKLENILLSESGTAKIADFGLSHHIARDGLLGTPCGSIEYSAPEILRGEHYDGRKVDIWSLGVVLYAMYMGGMPWSSHDPREVRAQVLSAAFQPPRSAPPPIRRLLEQMMDPDPEQRPTVTDLLSDPWIAQEKAEIRHSETTFSPLSSPRVVGVKPSFSLVESGRAIRRGIVSRGAIIVRPRMEGGKNIPIARILASSFVGQTGVC
jgi:serine/threonine protein kinase